MTVPIWFIVLMLLEFALLGYATKWFTVRLPKGTGRKCASYSAYNNVGLKRRKPAYFHTPLHSGNNFPDGCSPNGAPTYDIILSLGIEGVLCGWEWLDEHCGDMVDYKPTVYMTIGGVKYSMTIKQPAIIKDIMRVNHLTKKQKLAYAYEG